MQREQSSRGRADRVSRSSDIAGDPPADNTPDNATGNTPGNTPGDTPGNTPGNTPGDTPGDETEARSAALKQGMSIGLATGAYGISFGALAVAGGLSIWQTVALSALMFTGASQFAFASIFAVGGSPLAAVTTSTMLGLRHISYGALLAPTLRPMHPFTRAVAAQLTIDESTAVALAQPTRESRKVGFWSGGVSVYILWNAFTLAGALAGSRIGDPNAWGLDAAAAAAFLGLLWSHLKTPHARWTAALAGVLTLALTPLLPAGLPLLIAAAIAVAIGEWSRK